MMHDTINRISTFKLKTKVGTQESDSVFSIENGDWTVSKTIIEDDIDFPFERIDSTAINRFASKIFISMQKDFLDFDELSKEITQDFEYKNWPIAFGLVLRSSDCLPEDTPCDTLKTLGLTEQKGQLVARSHSELIPDHATLEIHFSNIASILIMRSIVGILLSLFLSGVIIFCLLYLFKTINEQKQLADIKNDLISNITHEFKTPITTIATALEGIENFSGLNDTVKTKKYLGISNMQLGKLNTMVEKLLETASIDSEYLQLNKEPVDLYQLIEQQLIKYRSSNENLTFDFESEQTPLPFDLDRFHIESAIGNLIDNAIKYGNGIVAVILAQENDRISIEVKDNGPGIPKDQSTRIFDKFYRIPTGNVHNVKGFGIGLYYAQHIIEKHGGTLTLEKESDMTTFKISLYHAH